MITGSIKINSEKQLGGRGAGGRVDEHGRVRTERDGSQPAAGTHRFLLTRQKDNRLEFFTKKKSFVTLSLKFSTFSKIYIFVFLIV